MKLSKIYSNNQNIFKTIEFDDGLNFILSDDHSVGKSTLFSLIDFCLLKDKPEFLKIEKFSELVFFLELKIDNNYITIKRPNYGTTNICIKLSSTKEYFIDLEDSLYDFKGGKDKAKIFLQENICFVFDNYRSYISYFLRDQDNQSDVFRLNKFIRSKDIEFKPVISNLLGIDGTIIRKKYELEDAITEINNNIIRYNQDLGVYKTKESILEEISLHEKQLEEKEHKYNTFDFYLTENNISKELVNKIEVEISSLNDKRNSLYREIDYINNSLENNISISIEEIEALFKETKILFPNDLKNNYESVINFNQQITKERTSIFKENKLLFEKELTDIEQKLDELNIKRKTMLSILKDTDTMSKFKKLEEEIINIKTNINTHKDKLEVFAKIDFEKKEKDNKEKELKILIKKQADLTKSKFINDLRDKIKMFGKIVFGKDLSFPIGFNTSDNIEFDLKIADQDGFDNYQDQGNTVKKLLCFVFACSLAVAYKDQKFIKFVAFDSPFDGDKNVWQDGVYNALKELSKIGIQTLITTISDEIKNKENMAEIRSKYTRRNLHEDDKLLGNF